MVILNVDISLYIIAQLDIVLYRKIILVNKWFFENYNDIYYPYWLEKHKMLDRIHSILINLFGYNKLLDAPLISINDINTLGSIQSMIAIYKDFLLIPN